MRKVLLGWQMVPETLDFYVIENPTDEELAVLKSATGILINCVYPDSVGITGDRYAADLVQVAIQEDKYLEELRELVRPGDEEWLGKWNKCTKLGWEEPIDLTGFDALYMTGFCL